MRPAKSILDQTRPWVPSHKTDIRESFRRHREMLERQRTIENADARRIISIFEARRKEQRNG